MMTTKSILLVEDEESIRLSIDYQLSKEGYDVDAVDNGEDANKKLVMDSSYDLVITDLRMGDESGVDVLQMVQETNVNIPVLIMSGLDYRSPLFKKAMELKPCGHAFKPFSKEVLLEKVRNCLEGTD